MEPLDKGHLGTSGSFLSITQNTQMQTKTDVLSMKVSLIILSLLIKDTLGVVVDMSLGVLYLEVIYTQMYSIGIFLVMRCPSLDCPLSEVLL